MDRYLAALDQGTTSTRCIIFDTKGRPVASAQREHRQIFPAAGWVEHEPDDLWNNTVGVIEEALSCGEIPVSDVVALGLANQRETTLVWNRHTGRPVCNAIVWQDTRTDAICQRLGSTEGADRFRDRVGLPLATYFAGPKLAWILEHVPSARADAERGELIFGTVDTWLLWNLTGGTHVTDVSNASRTMLMALDSLTWDADIAAEMGIPLRMLPEIRSSSDDYGRCAAGGPLPGVAIRGNLGDQHAAMLGQVCLEPGSVKNTYGTGNFMLMNTGPTPVRSDHGLLTTVCFKLGESPASYALEGSIAVTGSLVQWVRDNLGLISVTSEIEELAATVPDNGGVYFVPAFSGLFAPHWRSDARGVIAGLTRFVTKGHLARAALEATAFQTRDVVEAMNADAGVPLAELKVDGGMVNNELLMQFQSDILGVPIIRPVVAETTALGAAYAAGLAAGVWASPDELRSHWVEGRRWEPGMDEPARAEHRRNWDKAVSRATGWIDS